MRYIILLALIFVLASCTDTPYTGPMLTVDHVDRFLDSTGGDTVCLQDGFDSVCLKVLPGPQGVQGEPGIDGQDGKDGEQGTEGTKGDTGKDGKDGKDGKRGYRGPQGVQGEPGADGVDGQDGKDGKDGITIDVAEPTDNTAEPAANAITITDTPCETCGQPIAYVEPPPVTSHTPNPQPTSTPVVSVPPSIPLTPQPAQEPEPVEVVEEPEPVDDTLPAACGRWTTDTHEHEHEGIGLVSDYSAEQDRRDFHGRMGKRFREYYDIDEFSCGFHYHGDDHSDAHRHSSRANY